MAINASVLEDVNEPKEIVRVVHAATTLVTHLRPDLDALLALWMCQRLRRNAGISPAPVLFLPANEEGVAYGHLAIDMGKGKGVRPFGEGHCLRWSAHAEGGSSSMAVWRALPEDEGRIFEHLAKAISDADQRGDNLYRHLFNKAVVPLSSSTKSQVQATHLWAMHQASLNTHTDKQLCQLWSSMFDGFMVTGMMEKEAVLLAAQALFLCEGDLAVLPHNAPPPTSKVVFDKGAKLSIFSTEIGPGYWTLGVNRHAKKSAAHINLANYQDELGVLIPGIYVNRHGHLAGWTASSPLFATREEFEEKRETLIRAMVMVIERSRPGRR